MTLVSDQLGHCTTQHDTHRSRRRHKAGEVDMEVLHNKPWRMITEARADRETTAVDRRGGSDCGRETAVQNVNCSPYILVTICRLRAHHLGG